MAEVSPLPKLKVVSWNMARNAEVWPALLEPEPYADIALLQEAIPPPTGTDVVTVPSPTEYWSTAGGKRNFCAAVAQLNPRLGFRRVPSAPLPDVQVGQLGISRPGTLAGAHVDLEGEEPVTVVSWYGAWEKDVAHRWPYADASVHRLISDLSALIPSQTGHRLIVAGDLNILHSYGEGGNRYWGERYASVFNRMEALGVPFVGPQVPNGHQAEPLPKEMPEGCLDVPTFRTKRSDPGSASRQMDFVFASKVLHPRLNVRALNKEDEWGPSDHCRIMIELT